MKTPGHILLGYEVGTGEPVEIPLLNLAVTGQTQESGKTTTLEALAARSGATVLTFVTKRGEGSFAEARRVQPYFRDRADWQFVMGLIETMMKEKNKFLRQYVIPLCRTTHTLKDVKAEVAKKLAKSNSGIYVEIDAYLDLILPEIDRADMASKLDLRRGVNVMDLTDVSLPMQMLFVQSAIDWINDNETNTVVIIPEAWEFIPEGKSSPVKPSAEALVRKGSGIGNRIWVDSQDTAGVDKMVLRGCPVWIVGVQREANETARNLKNIPAPSIKLKPVDIQNLQRGQFFVAFGATLKKVYVQPAWMSAAAAKAASLGTPAMTKAPPAPIKKAEPPKQEDPDVKESEARELRRANQDLTRQVGDLTKRLEGLTTEKIRKPMEAFPAARSATILSDADALYAEFKRRLIEDGDPQIVRLLQTKPEINVVVERKTVEIDGQSLKGRVARLVSTGFYDKGAMHSGTRTELKRTGPDVNSGNLSTTLASFVKDGFLTLEAENKFTAVAGMKINLIKK